MLKREDELRRSSEVQAEMERAETSGESDWIEVAVKVQERVATEFGLPIDEGVKILRANAPKHPSICHWIRYNRARKGHLRPGQPAPNVRVVRVFPNGQRKHQGLFDDASGSKKKKTLVVAGSYS